jgi:rod shape-determining protein MreC
MVWSKRFLVFLGLALLLFWLPQLQLQSLLLEGVGRFLLFKEWLMTSLDMQQLYPERAALEKLVEENRRLHLRLHHASFLQEENKRLQKQLHCVQPRATTFVSAPVLTEPSSATRFFIGAGTREGVQKGQAVLFEQGFVGRIDQVSLTTARVTPLTHTSSRIPVVSADTVVHAILMGMGTQLPRLLYKNPSERLDKEAVFVTSSYGLGVPAGLLVGQLNQKANALRPFAPLRRLTMVQVITQPAPAPEGS